MQLSKIGSKNTYHKCVKQLHQAQYIIYHPAISKYQPVKISMIRLDTTKDISSYKQLNLFLPAEGGTSIINGTAHVPDLTDTSPNFSTQQVPKMGHIIKPNLKQGETPTHDFFKNNRKEKKDETVEAQVSKSVLVSLAEVEEYFKQSNHPTTEANKFYHHYKALGWKIQGKTPITDWKPLVEKWMTNAAKWDLSPSRGGVPTDQRRDGGGRDIQYLYEIFLEGKKVFHHITTRHFDLLRLQVTEETLKQARQERISQVTGTNQHSLNQLWDAYLKDDDNNPLIQKDRPVLIALTKRMEVLKHFHKLQQSGINLITIKTEKS